MIEEVPPEILIHIFSFSNLFDLLKFTGVCKKWCEIINDYIFKDRVIIRYKGQKLPSKYSSLHVALPVSGDEFLALMHDNVRELELRWDGEGDSAWRENEVDEIQLNLPCFLCLESVNLTGLNLNRRMYYRFNWYNLNEISLRIITGRKVADVEIFWLKREKFKELILVQEGIFFGYFKDIPSAMTETLLRSVCPTGLQLEGEFSGQLLTRCLDSLSCVTDLALDSLHEEGNSNFIDALATLPLLKKLSIFGCLLPKDLGGFTKSPCLEKLRFAFCSETFDEMAPLVSMPLSTLILVTKVPESRGFLSNNSWSMINTQRLDIMMDFDRYEIHPLLSNLQNSTSLLRSLVIPSFYSFFYNSESLSIYMTPLKNFCQDNGIDLKVNFKLDMKSDYCMLLDNIDTLFFS